MAAHRPRSRTGRGPRRAGVQVKADFAPVRPAALSALEKGVIVKDTQVTTLRIAPPLVIEESDLNHGIDIVLGALADL